MRRLSLLLLLALTVTACDSSENVVEANSTVTVDYEGRLADGRVFDRGSEVSFSLQRVIPGFRDGLIGMSIGQTRTFDIPPDQAYGANPPAGSIIPPNATLTFEVTILDIQ